MPTNPITTAINTYSSEPGMVAFLNAIRSVPGFIPNAAAVPAAAQFGRSYCHPRPEDYDAQGVSTDDEYRAAIESGLDLAGLTDAQVQQVRTALTNLRTANP